MWEVGELETNRLRVGGGERGDLPGRHRGNVGIYRPWKLGGPETETHTGEEQGGWA